MRPRRDVTTSATLTIARALMTFLYPTIEPQERTLVTRAFRNHSQVNNTIIVFLVSDKFTLYLTDTELRLILGLPIHHARSTCSP